MDDLLAYMKSALEGTENIPLFVEWFAENEHRLSAELDRGTFLRLKEQPLAEFARILQERNIKYTPSPVSKFPAGRNDFSWIQPDWLGNRIYPHELPRLFGTNLPKGTFHVILSQLLHLVEPKQTGDELWNFSSPSVTWERMAGRGGICLVRNCRVIYAIVLMMN